MPLECLLLTGDAALLGAIRAKFSQRGVEIVVRNDATSAVELSKGRHLDGFVIDCDDVPRGKQALSNIACNLANRRPVVVAVISGETSISQAFEMGAHFVLSKPLQDDRLGAFVDLAVPKMEREHRRYFRYEVDLPVRLEPSSGGTLVAKMLNISEGGFAIRVGNPLPEGVLNVQFDLPSIEPEKFKGRAVVVWASDCIAGLRFLHIEPRCRAGFQAWRNSLKAQLQFRESAQADRM
jgi:hypothetical protein